MRFQTVNYVPLSEPTVQRVIQIKVVSLAEADKFPMEWEPIATAPFDRDLELAVFDTAGQAHALVFPCRRVVGGWVDAETKKKLIDVRPTHWREWRRR